MSPKKTKFTSAANPELAAAMRELRQGSRTDRHVDRHAEARKGRGKGGRHAWKRDAHLGIRPRTPSCSRHRRENPMSTPAAYPSDAWSSQFTTAAASHTGDARVSLDGDLVSVSVDGRDVAAFHLNAIVTTPGGEGGSSVPASVAVERAAAHGLRASRITPSNILADVEGRGYIVDEWERWQQGSCDVYALALLAQYPHLRFAVMGHTEAGGGDPGEGWMESHYFAHDDEYAYDSAGRHPLPYLGVDADADYAELDAIPDEWGIGPGWQPDAAPGHPVFDAAVAHITRHADTLAVAGVN